MAVHMMRLSGKIANVVFYEMNGKLIARSAPGKAKRTAPMKKRNSNFGIASNVGKLVRKAFNKIIPKWDKSMMHSRLTGCIAGWLGSRDIKALEPEPEILQLRGFQLNEHCSLPKLCKLQPAISITDTGSVQIDIPAFVPAKLLLAPQGTFSVEMEFHAVSIIVSAKSVNNGQETVSIKFPYDDAERPAQTLELPLARENGSLVVIGCAIRYWEKGAGSCTNELKWLPAGILQARFS